MDMTMSIDSEYRPVLSKADFVNRYLAGEFGNASPTWHTLEDFLGAQSSLRCSTDRYHLRNRQAGGETYYNLKAQELINLWSKVRSPSLFYTSQMAPTHLTVIQGEVQRLPFGLYLYYTHGKLPMRDALRASSAHANGIIANCILQATMSPKSWEWLTVLLDRYDDHVVEFSTYSTEWGTVPGYDTVYWEVRKY